MGFLKTYQAQLLVLFSIIIYVFLAYQIERTDYLLLLLSWILLFAGYYFLVQNQKITTKFLIGAAVVFRLIFLFTTPFLSQDFYRFVWDGRMLLEGLNPYLSVPETFITAENHPIQGAEELYAGMGTLNGGNFTNYPPVNQFFFYLGALVSKGSLFGNIVAFRVFILLADLGIIALGTKILKEVNLPEKNIYWYALNPFIIIEMTGNLHFEPVMLFFLLAGCYFFMQKKWILAALFIALSVSLKLIPLIFLPLFLRPLLHSTSSEAILKKLIRTGGFYVLCIGFVLLLFVPFFSEQFMANYMNSVGLWFRKFEFNASFYYLFREIGYGFRGYNEIAIIGKITPVITLVFVTWIAIFRKNEQHKVLLTSMVFAISFYYFFSSTVHPWYIATPLLLGAFTRYRFPIVWSFLLIISYQVYASNPWKENLSLIALEYVLLYGYLLFELKKHHSKKDDLIIS